MLARFLLATLTAAVPAQESEATRGALERSRLFGLVRQSDGSPWVGVPVHLAAVPAGVAAVTEPLETLTATTDARGRFRAEVITGWRYAVWAGAEDAAGRRRSTGVVDAVTGDPVVLEEGHAPEWRVRPAGLDAWAEHGPFRLRIGCAAVGLATEVPIGSSDAGPFALPLLPSGALITVALLDAKGRQRASTYAYDSVESPVTLPLAPPREHLIRLGTEDGTATIPEGRLLAALGDVCVPFDTIPAGGRLRIVMPEAPAEAAWQYRVLVPGFAPAVLKETTEAPEGDAEAAEVIAEGGRIWQCWLVRGERVRTRLLGPGDRPLAGARVKVTGQAHSKVADGHYFGAETRFLLTTDAEGRLDFTGHRRAWALELLVEPGLLGEFPESWRGIEPWAHLPGDTESPELRVEQDLWCARIRVVTHEGAPVTASEVRVLAKRGDDSDPHRSDRSGIVRCLLPHGDLIVRADGESAFRWESWTVGGERAAGRVADLTLRLDPRAFVHIAVLGLENDRPAAGAQVSLFPDRRGPAELLGRPTEDVTAEGVSLKGRALPRELMPVLIRDVTMTRSMIEADAQGVVKHPMPYCTTGLQLYVIRNGNGSDCGSFTFDASAPEELRVRVPG